MLIPDLHVQDTGAGLPIILLHSSGLSGRQWRRLAEALPARGYRAVVPDLAGHGRAPEWPAPRPFSFTRDVERLGSLLEALGQPAHLVGHSYGGFLALLVAKQAPSRVRSLAVYDPVAMGTLDPDTDADAGRDLARVRFEWDGSPGGQERWLATFVDYWGGSGAWLALREDARAEFRRVAWVVYEGARTLVSDTTRAAAYHALEMPVLLLGGEQSPLAARRVVARLAASLPSVTVETIAGAGHMGPLSHADAVNERILRWIG
jgi:pimeloyl-ACP methyl ester carboxylesterase